ncbi:MAG TPA: SAM-dependent chlorinase/fluorinase [Vicinamibacterales bacterium]|nr:SAM-dependent chlorinase/fluorinase [Vicinamibacterales bacterium]
MARPVIAFLTDFGTKDHYAGTVKGVVLSICPEAACVDITHEIPPHDVMAGALELAAAYKYFPSGTVFVVVVDPGVGSARRPIAAEAGDYRFVAPDNGVLTLVFNETPPRRVVALTEPQYARPTVSRTFEGRDRFGPAAAWLARGIELSAFGRTLNDWQTLDVPEPIITEAQMIAEVVRVDRFGNLVTNVDRRTFDRFLNAERIEIVAGAATVGEVVMTYADADPGASCALFGSSEHLEIAVNGGSAAERLALGRGAKITISKLHQGA